jgi:hypothetical protein
MYLQRKNQYCIFILRVLFCCKTETRYTLCSGGPSLELSRGLLMIFSKNVPYNTTWKWESRHGT